VYTIKENIRGIGGFISKKSLLPPSPISWAFSFKSESIELWCFSVRDVGYGPLDANFLIDQSEEKTLLIN